MSRRRKVQGNLEKTTGSTYRQQTEDLKQAIKMRKFSEEGKLGEDVILSILTEERPNQVEQFKIPKKHIEKYFLPGTPREKIEDTIIKALEMYRKRERNKARER